MQAARRVLLVLSHPASPPFRASHPLCHAWEREREDLESAVTSAAGDGSLGNLENEVHSGTTRNGSKAC